MDKALFRPIYESVVNGQFKQAREQFNELPSDDARCDFLAWLLNEEDHYAWRSTGGFDRGDVHNVMHFIEGKKVGGQ